MFKSTCNDKQIWIRSFTRQQFVCSCIACVLNDIPTAQEGESWWMLQLKIGWEGRGLARGRVGISKASKDRQSYPGTRLRATEGICYFRVCDSLSSHFSIPNPSPKGLRLKLFPPVCCKRRFTCSVKNSKPHYQRLNYVPQKGNSLSSVWWDTLSGKQKKVDIHFSPLFAFQVKCRGFWAWYC